MRIALYICCLAVLLSVSRISAQSCTTNEQCTDLATAPICRNGACAACNESMAEECVGRSPNNPICSGGGCLPCLTAPDFATECGVLLPATPICVNETGACRACAADSECTIYGETVRCQGGSCVGLGQNEGLIIAVCFIAAIVILIIALILWARLKKKKKDAKKAETNAGASNINNNSVKNSARNAPVGSNKDVPMDDMPKKEPIAINNKEASSSSSEQSSSSQSGAQDKSGSEDKPAAEGESGDSNDSDDSESSSDSDDSEESSGQSSDQSSGQSSSAQSSPAN